MEYGKWIKKKSFGAGTFGNVHLALNAQQSEEFCAVKSSKGKFESKQALKHEIDILQILDSPFIVKCLGSSFEVEFGEGMVRNLFMEYMSEGSVADIMKKKGGRLEEPLIRTFTRSILERMRYLHSKNIVHCDIKGLSVLVGSTVLKLADFGCSTRMGVDVYNPKANLKGTQRWMAPEVVLQVEQGPASDIWSLGCTVVKMATGAVPWSKIVGDKDKRAVLEHIGYSREVPEMPSCLSEQGQDFLRKCFQLNPRDRWTARELRDHPFITDNFIIPSSKHKKSKAGVFCCGSKVNCKGENQIKRYKLRIAASVPPNVGINDDSSTKLGKAPSFCSSQKTEPKISLH